MLSKLSSSLQTKDIAALFAVYTVVCLTSCSHVPSVPICVEINPTKGFCTETINDKDYDIDEEHPVAFEGDAKPMTWWERKPFMVLLPASSWASLKKYIIQSCKRNNCDQYVKSWDRKIMELDPGVAK